MRPLNIIPPFLTIWNNIAKKIIIIPLWKKKRNREDNNERNCTILYTSTIIILFKSILSLCLLAPAWIVSAVILTCLPPLSPSLLFTPFLLSPPVNPVFDRVSPEFPANNALALVIVRVTRALAARGGGEGGGPRAHARSTLAQRVSFERVRRFAARKLFISEGKGRAASTFAPKREIILQPRRGFRLGKRVNTPRSLARGHSLR